MVKTATKPVKRVVFDVSDPLLTEEIESISLYYGKHFAKLVYTSFVNIVKGYPEEVRTFKKRQEELDNRPAKMSVSR